jgi:hypothetical protein
VAEQNNRRPGSHRILNPGDPKFRKEVMMKALEEGTADAEQQLAASNAIYNLTGVLGSLPRPLVKPFFDHMEKTAPPEVREAAHRAAMIDAMEDMPPQGRRDN